jgi:hypothetical protein
MFLLLVPRLLWLTPIKKKRGSMGLLSAKELLGMTLMQAHNLLLPKSQAMAIKIQAIIGRLLLLFKWLLVGI